MNTIREVATLVGLSIPFGVAVWMWLSKTHPVLTVLKDLGPDEPAQPVELRRAA